MSKAEEINWKLLFETARKALKQSHSPYSNFKVGAAVLTAKGMYAGTNIENASFGLTICAERVALHAAVMAEGPKRLRLRAVAILNSRSTPCAPCGACLQVLSEFGPDPLIAFPGLREIEYSSLARLLPRSFALLP